MENITHEQKGERIVQWTPIYHYLALAIPSMFPILSHKPPPPFFFFFAEVFSFFQNLCRSIVNSQYYVTFSSVQFSLSVTSNSLRPHGPQHTRPPCLSPTPGVHPNPCPLSWWCHPTISSSVIPFSSSPQSYPASGSFQVSKLFR